MLKKLLVTAALLAPLPAIAQNVQYAGPITRGHVPVWNTAGVIADGGSSASSPITSFGVTNNGGSGICVNSALPTAAGYQALCFGTNTTGPATISLQSYGTATQQPLQFIINGTTYPFPGSLADITIGTTPVVGGTNSECLFVSGGFVGQQTCTLSAITSLVGDVIASGPGISTATLATTNVNPGTFGSGALVPIITVNGKGLVTNVTTTPLSITVGSTTIASGTSNGLLFDSAGVVGNLATAVNGVLVTSGTAIPSISSTLPGSISATNMLLTTPTLGVATGTSLALNACTLGSNVLCLAGPMSMSGQFTSTLANGTAPFVVASSTNVANLNASSLNGATFGAPGAIGGVTPGTGAFTTIVGTSTSATALAIGANGTTNPVLQIDASTGSVATGILIKGGATGGGTTITATDSGANTALAINSKGSGIITLGATSTGAIQIGAGGGGLTVSNSFTATGLVTYADLLAGTSDTALGYWGATTVSALAINNCANALTYSTSTHAFGCNSSAGTGTVTSVGTSGLATGGPITSTGTVTVTAAAKSDQQTGTSTTLAVTPSQQQSHDSASKAWITFTGSSGANLASYNVTSFGRNSAGNYTATFTTAFASANYVCNVTSESAGIAASSAMYGIVTTGTAKTTTTVTLVFYNSAGTSFEDPTTGHLVCYGRQ